MTQSVAANFKDASYLEYQYNFCNFPNRCYIHQRKIIVETEMIMARSHSESWIEVDQTFLSVQAENINRIHWSKECFKNLCNGEWIVCSLGSSQVKKLITTTITNSLIIIIIMILVVWSNNNHHHQHQHHQNNNSKNHKIKNNDKIRSDNDNNNNSSVVPTTLFTSINIIIICLVQFTERACNS